MKRILAVMFFAVMMTTTVNAQSITFSYLEDTVKIASHSTKKHMIKKRKVRQVTAASKANSGSYASYTSMIKPSARHNAGPRPGKWCGWYMRKLYGGGPEYNLARNWAKRGSATGPRVGAVVVWRNHVGVIVGKASNGSWLVHSGNTTGGKIATKPRSVANAIAFRML